MHIELYNISKLIKVENNKIVLVKVLEQNNNEALIEINGEKFKARVEAKIPPTFFAYVEKSENGNKIRINLRIIENLKSIGNFKVERNEAEIVRNFLFFNSLPLTETNIFIALKLIKNNLSLNIANFELFRFAYRKYKKIPDFLVLVLQNEKNIDKDFVDIIFNLKEIFRKIELSDINNLKELKLDDTELQKNNILNNLVFILNEFSGNKINFSIFQRKYKDDNIFVLLRTEERNGRKRYYFDLSSEIVENFLVIIDLDKLNLEISVFLDEQIISEFNSKIREEEEKLKSKLKNIFKERKIKLDFHRYKRDLIFENIISAENMKNDVKNLDIII